jgi:hypothetical protein
MQAATEGALERLLNTLTRLAELAIKAVEQALAEHNKDKP